MVFVNENDAHSRDEVPKPDFLYISSTPQSISAYLNTRVCEVVDLMSEWWYGDFCHFTVNMRSQ